MSGTRTLGALGRVVADPASPVGETDINDGLLVTIVSRRPLDARLPGRAGYPLLIPIDGKAIHIEAVLGFGLPTRRAGRAPHNLDAILLAGIHDQLTFHIARIQ